MISTLNYDELTDFRRLIVPGPKHSTACYVTRNVFLDFWDLAWHIYCTANDNQHRVKYARSRMAEFLAEIVDLGYGTPQLNNKDQIKGIYDKLQLTCKKYYGKIIKKKNLRIYFEEIKPPPTLDDYFDEDYTNYYFRRGS